MWVHSARNLELFNLGCGIMNIVPQFDLFEVMYEVEVNGICCVPLNSVHHNFAVFMSPENYEKLPNKGFMINKENKLLLDYKPDDFRKLICSDRVIRIFSHSKNGFKTIFYIVNSSFYTRRCGLKLEFNK